MIRGIWPQRAAYRLGLVLLAVVLLGLAVWQFRLARSDQAAPPQGVGVAAATGAPAGSVVIARGRIEPDGRTHLVSGPSRGGTVTELRVSEGSRVQAGDILAVLDTHLVQLASVRAAERDLATVSLERSQVMAGAKPSDIVAQEASVAARQAELVRADQQVTRSRSMVEKKFVSSDALEQHELEQRRAQQNLGQARATLRALTEVRTVDVQVASARIAQAQARLAEAQANLALTVVRAPIAGTVLAISARPGAMLGMDGVLTMANLDRLIVVAEVDEHDAPRLRAGAAATVQVRQWPAPLQGRVTKILNQVAVTARPTTDVLRGRDARVVEVEVAFDSGQSVPPFPGTEATVSIAIANPSTK